MHLENVLHLTPMRGPPISIVVTKNPVASVVFGRALTCTTLTSLLAIVAEILKSAQKDCAETTSGWDKLVTCTSSGRSAIAIAITQSVVCSRKREEEKTCEIHVFDEEEKEGNKIHAWQLYP